MCHFDVNMNPVIGRYLLDCRLSLRLAAQSTLGLFFKIIDVTVVLNDVNDNAPSFTPSVTELTIMENADVGDLFQVNPADGCRRHKK